MSFGGRYRCSTPGCGKIFTSVHGLNDHTTKSNCKNKLKCVYQAIAEVEKRRRLEEPEKDKETIDGEVEMPSPTVEDMIVDVGTSQAPAAHVLQEVRYRSMRSLR